MPAQAPSAMNMPMPKNKKELVGKTPAPQRFEPTTVKDCMFWPEKDPKQKGKGKKGKGGNKNQEVRIEEAAPKPEYSLFIHGQSDVGKARSHGFDLHTPPPPPRKDDETAIRALRGWSDTFPGEEANEQGDPYMGETQESLMYQEEQERIQKKKKKKGKKDEKKEEGKKGLMAMYDDDVHVADVLSYRYGNEEAERRQKQQEKQQAKKERAEAEAADAKKAMKKVKHTQASIARTNRNIEKCTEVEQDLWKMSKFKNIPTRLDTKRDKPFSHHNANGGNHYGEGDAITIRGECRPQYADYADMQNDFAEVNINTGSPDPYTGEYQILNEGPYQVTNEGLWNADYSECNDCNGYHVVN